jgi:uncharacterized membrane protein
MTIVGLIIGMIVGGAVAEGPGVVLGGAIGLTLGMLYAVRRDLQRTQSRLEHLDDVVAAMRIRLEALARRRPVPDEAEAEAQAERVLVIEDALEAAGALSAEEPPAGSAAEPPIGSAAQPPLETVAVSETGTVSEAEAETPTEAEHIRPPAAVKVHEHPPEQPIEDPVGRALEGIRVLLFGGNSVVRIGVVVLLCGVGFLVKYAAEKGFFSPGARLASSAALGIALLAVGWRLRHRRRGYGLSLQGGGAGVLYVTVLAALRLYSMLSAPVAFAILATLVALSSALAVAQDALALAVLSALGGFAAPILVSTGKGSALVLFGFYFVLDLGIAAIAWFGGAGVSKRNSPTRVVSSRNDLFGGAGVSKRNSPTRVVSSRNDLFRSWRPLNLLGFVCTFVLGTLWGLNRYGPDEHSVAQIYLVLFFLLFVTISVVYAWRQPPKLKGIVDGALVFALPICAFGLQVPLAEDYHHGLTWSALVLAFFYAALAAGLRLRAPEALRNLSEAFTAISVVFLTMTLAFAFEGTWTGAAWAFEGAGLVWIGVRQRRRLARAAGLLLQPAAGVALLLHGPEVGAGPAVVNTFHLGSIVIALGAGAAAFALFRGDDKVDPWERVAGRLVLAWAVGWWAIAGCLEIEDRVTGSRKEIPVHLAFAAGTGLLFTIAGKLLRWRDLRLWSFALIPALALLLAMTADAGSTPLDGLGLPVWPAAAAVMLLALWLANDDLGPRTGTGAHGATVWVLTVLLSWYAARFVTWLTAEQGSFDAICAALGPALLVLAVSTFGLRLRWPVGEWRAGWMAVGLGPVCAYAWLWSVAVNLLDPADPWPLPLYMPILNPLDLALALVFGSLFVWGRRVSASNSPGAASSLRILAMLAGGASLLLWISAGVLRAVHHWLDVAWDMGALLDSVVAQAALSIAWTLLAMGTMLLSTRHHRRDTWLASAVLLAAVVLKLFTVDLSRAGTVARIVSFLAVGALFLVIGYVSPVPPRRGGPR